MIAIVRPVARAVAVAAFPVVEPDDPLTLPVTLPVSAAEIVPALKLPDASRATIADAVFALVAVVAELLTLDAVEIVASFVSTIAADALMSALTMLVAKLSFEYAIAALAFTSASTITPLPIAVTKLPVPLPVTSPVSVIVWSPVFVPLRFEPVTEPLAATLVGVIAPSVRLIAGVVVEVATVPDTPFAVLTETDVTVPPASATKLTFVPSRCRLRERLTA